MYSKQLWEFVGHRAPVAQLVEHELSRGRS